MATRKSIPLDQRFWSKVRKAGPTECWEWIAGRDSCGYGRINVGGLALLAHRISWGLSHGALKPSECVLHRCDNPPCVNPDHLFVGSVADNNHDRNAKGRTSCGRGDGHGMKKIDSHIVPSIRAALAAGRSQQSIADEFGVSQVAISKIKLGKLWRHA